MTDRLASFSMPSRRRAFATSAYSRRSRSVPRQEFVAPASRRRAYEDVPLPIPHGLVTTQPSLIARMVEALELGGDERVLEVGTGLRVSDRAAGLSGR